MEELFEELVGDGSGSQNEPADRWYDDYDYPIEGGAKHETDRHSSMLAKLGYAMMGVMVIPAIVFVCAVFATCSKMSW